MLPTSSRKSVDASDFCQPYTVQGGKNVARHDCESQDWPASCGCSIHAETDLRIAETSWLVAERWSSEARLSVQPASENEASESHVRRLRQPYACISANLEDISISST